MKPRIVFFLPLLMLWASNVPGFSQAETAPTPSPEVVIKEFYKWYVHALNQDGDPLTKGRATLRKYVTIRFIREIDRALKGPDGIDADVFLEAQDWDKDWEKNIAVSKVATRYSTTTAMVSLSGKEMPTHKLNLTLKREGGAWKIDKVAAQEN
jgi:hypothetical protein